jgi:hypothetical protein
MTDSQIKYVDDKLKELKELLINSPNIMKHDFLVDHIFDKTVFNIKCINSGFIEKNNEQNNKVKVLHFNFKEKQYYKEIDKELAPMISELWKAKLMAEDVNFVNTPNNYVALEFRDTVFINRFFETLFSVYTSKENIKKSELYNRVFKCPKYIDGAWICNFNVNFNEDSYDSYATTTLFDEFIDTKIIIKFPFKDCEYIYQKFKEYNEIKEREKTQHSANKVC